jgi:hypothetical protein
MVVYNPSVRRAALALAEDGLTTAAISRRLCVSRAAVSEWLGSPERALAPRNSSRCFACTAAPCPYPDTYAYLLGQYLGDGYLVTSIRVPKLRIACSDAYPAIAAEVDAAMLRVSGNRPGAVAGVGCSDRYTYWMHWPCLLPQHGPGMKHSRPIVRADWQRAIVDEHPWSLIRGLIQSDGCRTTNRVVVHGVAYAYPRYFFSNESRDILQIMGDALDRVAVAWRFNRPNCISIAKRDAVALMDEHVGPKA